MLDVDEGPWGEGFAAIAALWRRHWTHVILFFAYPPEVRRMIYTTNAIDAKLRRSVHLAPSPFTSLQMLAPRMRLVSQRERQRLAEQVGFSPENSKEIVSSGVERFCVDKF